MFKQPQIKMFSQTRHSVKFRVSQDHPSKNQVYKVKRELEMTWTVVSTEENTGSFPDKSLKLL